ncbi:hypothetical protein ACFXG4_48755, partial [Nocardia sp. NPDC059246]
MSTEAMAFDAIIVGAGQAEPPLAGRLVDAGQTVAVVDWKLVGGTHSDQCTAASSRKSLAASYFRCTSSMQLTCASLVRSQYRVSEFDQIRPGFRRAFLLFAQDLG